MTKSKDQIYMEMALKWGENSKCTRKKVGALIVKNNNIISDGYNGMPHGFNDNECEYICDTTLLTNDKVLHAESNAITKLAKSTVSGEDSTLYITLSPCFECAKLIIQSGIKEVIYLEPYRKLRGLRLLKEAKIKYNRLTL